MKRCKIAWQEVINRHNYLPIEVQLNLFQWMIATGWEYRGPERWGVFEWLYDLSGRNCQYPDGLGQGFDGAAVTQRLRIAFVGAIADTRPPEPVLEWRAAYGIGLGQPYKMLPLRDGQHFLQWRDLHTLFGFVGQALQLQLNSVHARANLVTRVLLTPSQHGWQVILQYGIPEGKWGCCWDKNLLPERTPSVAEAVTLATQQLSKWTATA